MDLSQAENRVALIASCRQLGQVFATRAPENDRLAAFPVENFADLRQAGLLGLMVPASHGGMGADFLTYTRALEQLAIGDASTGLTFNMHNIVTGGLSEVDLSGVGGRRGKAMTDFRDWLFDQVISEKKVFASATSEPGVGAQFTKLQTTYRRVDGGFVLNGVKSFVSMAGHADYYVVAARSEGSTGPIPALSYLVVELGNPGVRFDDAWDVLGMRSTASNAMYLEDCFVPTERLFLQTEGMVFYKVTREPHWLVGGYNGVYLGICTAIFEFMTEYLGKKTIPGTDRTFAHDPVVQHQVGELDIALEAARSVTYGAARLVAEQPGHAGSQRRHPPGQVHGRRARPPARLAGHPPLRREHHRPAAAAGALLPATPGAEG